jgi:hypothetical protein
MTRPVRRPGWLAGQRGHRPEADGTGAPRADAGDRLDAPSGWLFHPSRRARVHRRPRRQGHLRARGTRHRLLHAVVDESRPSAVAEPRLCTVAVAVILLRDRETAPRERRLTDPRPRRHRGRPRATFRPSRRLDPGRPPRRWSGGAIPQTSVSGPPRSGSLHVDHRAASTSPFARQPRRATSAARRSDRAVSSLIPAWCAWLASSAAA